MIDLAFKPRGYWWHRLIAACVLAIENFKLRRSEYGSDYSSWIEDVDRLARRP